MPFARWLKRIMPFFKKVQSVPKPRVPKPPQKTPFEGLTRRQFLGRAASLGAGLALGASFASSCRVPLASTPFAVPPPQRPSGTRSIRALIESTPGIQSKEMGWYREKGMHATMRPAATERGEGFVRMQPPTEKDVAEVHSHPYPSTDSPIFSVRRERLHFVSLPSCKDLEQFLSRLMVQHALKKGQLRYLHLPSIDENGQVVGYYSLRAGKKLLERVARADPELKYVQAQLGALDKVYDELPKHKNPHHDFLALVEKQRGLCEILERMGLQARATPVKGYVLVDGYFEKKERL